MSGAAEYLLMIDTWSACSLVDEALTDRLQEVLRQCAPNWSSELKLVYDEEDREYGPQVDINRAGALYKALAARALQAKKAQRANYEELLKAAKRYGSPVTPYDEECLMDSAILGGATDDLMVYLDFDTKPRLLESNAVGAQLYSRSFEGRRTESWTRSSLELIATNLPIDYGRACLKDEFEAKNMDYSRGSKAIGVDLSRSLPGLYWLNYFGPLLCDFIGRDKLITAPAYEARRIGKGVLIALGQEPEHWHTAEYQRREKAVETHLGKEFFFSREDPKRRTRAPQFG